MRVKRVLKDIVEVALSNAFTILSGIIVSFAVPKILSIESYGYYKIFTLYVSYIGLFSLGIIDGIVLKYGASDLEALDTLKFRSYFKWYIIVNGFFTVLLTLIGITIPNMTYGFILVSLGINLMFVNISGYFQQISQITQRFKEYSIRKVLQSFFNIVGVAVLYLIYKNKGVASYKIYILLVLAVNLTLMIWYIRTYNFLIFGNTLKLKETKHEVKELMKMGFPLLFSNLCATLILALDRQFVSILFDTTTYAVYAFAYNMLSLVTVATSALSTVLYPTLKRTREENLRENYGMISSVVIMFVFVACVLYFPLYGFISWFLPQYIDSLVIFRIIFPGLAISSSITIVMHNYYKVTRESFRYFVKSIIVLLFSVCANYVAYYLFRTTISISVASILSILFWYVYVEQLFVKRYHYNRWPNFLYLVVMMMTFYFVSMASNKLFGFVLYVVLYLSISFILKHNEIKHMMEQLM